MAWTVTKENVSLGSKNGVILNITTDSAEANITTGLGQIDGYTMGIKSLTAIGITMFPNVNSTGTASPGSIGASGFTSGDEFCLVVYGR